VLAVTAYLHECAFGPSQTQKFGGIRYTAKPKFNHSFIYILYIYIYTYIYTYNYIYTHVWLFELLACLLLQVLFLICCL
jgi:hypothetical protein